MWDLEKAQQQVGESSYTPIYSRIWGGSRNSGLACMAISSAAYSIMGLLVKLLAVRQFPSSQIVVARCGVVALLSGLGLRRMGHPLLGSPAVKKLVIARAVVGFVALSTYFYSIQALPLRDATILNFTTPVFTAVLAACLLGEAWGLLQTAGTLCSFAGVLLVMQPAFLFPGNNSAERRNENVYVGVAMAVIGSCTGALSYIIVRIVGKRGEPPLVCVFAFAAFSAPSAAVAAMFQGFKLPGLLEAVEHIGVGLSAYAAQVFLTRALQLEAAGRATSIQYVKVVCTYILGVVFLGERPSLLGASGALLISLSAGFISFASSSTNAKRAT